MKPSTISTSTITVIFGLNSHISLIKKIGATKML